MSETYRGRAGASALRRDVVTSSAIACLAIASLGAGCEGRLELSDVAASTVELAQANPLVVHYELPPALAEDASLHVATLDEGGVLVGGRGGCFRLTTEGFEQLDDRVVKGLARFGDALLVGYPDGLWLWRGGDAKNSEMLALPAELQRRPLAALGLSDADRVWVATDQDLLLYGTSDILRFDVGRVRRLTTFGGAGQLVIETLDADFRLLRKSGTTWATQLLGVGRLDAEQIVPVAAQSEAGTGGATRRLVALAEGTLWEARELASSPVRRWAALIVAGPDGPQRVHATQVAVEPAQGCIWAASDDSVYRLGCAGPALRFERSAQTKPLLSLHGASPDEVWLNDGARLTRLRRGDLIARPGANDKPAPAAVGYAKDVAPFIQRNCLRCHSGEKGGARSLASYDALAKELTRSIKQLNGGLMPLDGRALEGGDVQLLERWRDGGLAE